MTALDRFVLSVAPRYGMRRLKAKAAAGYIWSRSGGGYDAGRSTSKELQEWQPDVDSAISSLHPGLYDMRSRSRDVVRNNALAGGAMDQACRSVIGTGLRARPMIDHDLLGISDEAAEEWNEQAKRCFEMWAEPEGGCDISMNRSFEELQALVFRAVFEGGDLLVLDRWLPERGAPFASCVQFIEAERVCNPDWETDTEELAGGVEIDLDTGMTMAYHCTRDHPGDYQFEYDWLRLPAWNERGERVARLVFRPHRVGERRGVPWLATILKPLKQLDRFTNAELQAAVISSFFTAFVYDEHPESDMLGDGVMDDPGPESSAATVLQEGGDLRLGHGLIGRLGPGERVTFADPDRPNDLFAPFVESMWQHIGIGLGMPYEVFTMRFQESYSAAKGALAEAAKTFKVAKSLILTHFCYPAYRRVIAESVASGKLKAPGFFEDPMKQRAWCRSSWMGDAMASLDPEREIKAARERITGGVSTIDRESREITGTTAKENLEQRLKEAKMEAEINELLTPEPEEPAQVTAGSGSGGSKNSGSK